jgi:hypothetical protein
MEDVMKEKAEEELFRREAGSLRSAGVGVVEPMVWLFFRRVMAGVSGEAVMVLVVEAEERSREERVGGLVNSVEEELPAHQVPILEPPRGGESPVRAMSLMPRPNFHQLDVAVVGWLLLLVLVGGVLVNADNGFSRDDAIDGVSVGESADEAKPPCSTI